MASNWQDEAGQRRRVRVVCACYPYCLESHPGPTLTTASTTTTSSSSPVSPPPDAVRHPHLTSPRTNLTRQDSSMPESLDRSLSSLSIHSSDSQPEDDWDRSLVLEGGPVVVSDVFSGDSATASDSTSTSTASTTATVSLLTSTTPRNSIVFPAEDTPGRATRYSSSASGTRRSRNGSVDGMGAGKGGNRTLSELLRLHSEKGSNGKFSAEEASRIADVLGQWINASSSPYEGEDDFFAPTQSQDDISVASRRLGGAPASGRPRGRSESANSNLNLSMSGSRPPSSMGAPAS